jgi:hypothetical protein
MFQKPHLLHKSLVPKQLCLIDHQAQSQQVVKTAQKLLVHDQVHERDKLCSHLKMLKYRRFSSSDGKKREL